MALAFTGLASKHGAPRAQQGAENPPPPPFPERILEPLATTIQGRCGTRGTSVTLGQ